MGVLVNTMPTFQDFAARQTPEGSIDREIAELLHTKKELFQYLPWREGNLDTGHQTTVRTSIPEPAWKKMYGYTQPTKSTTAHVVASCGMLEDYGQVDYDMLMKEGGPDSANGAAFLVTEDAAKIEGFGQKVSRYFIYGNESTEPESFTGLAQYFTATTNENGRNIIKADGSPSGADQTSVYLCVFGPATGFAMVPKGMRIGFNARSLGEQTDVDPDGGGLRQVFRTHYQQKCGFVIRDWRYFARICNIDTSALTKNAATGTDLIDCMAQAEEVVQDLNMGTAVWLMNRKVAGFLRRQTTAKVANSTLTVERVGGKKVRIWNEIPVAIVDEILNTEDVIS